MKTPFRWYLLGLLALFGAYVALEYYRPTPLDWTPTYINKDKIPYGTYALFDQLPRLLGNDSVEAVRVSAYTQLTGGTFTSTVEDAEVGPQETATVDSATANTEIGPPEAPVADSAATTDAAVEPQEASAVDSAVDEETEPQQAPTVDSAADAAVEPQQASTADSAADAEVEPQEASAVDRALTASTQLPTLNTRANYLFINDNFNASAPDVQALLHYVALGNDVFVAADYFQNAELRDSLGFYTNDAAIKVQRGPNQLPEADSVTVRFTNPALAGARYRLPALQARARLVVKAGRLGRTLATDAQGRAVLVRLDYGEGHFYLCSVPLAFTNYYFLRPHTAGFAAGALAYLPARRTWWDEYQKQGLVGEQSLLRVLLRHPALRTAYYLTLLGALLFVLVEARRRQRIIPVIKPLPNTTLLFTRTVAGLYQQGRNHALIAEKKVALFLNYLRVRFQETSPNLGDDDFRERLSQKAGLPRSRVDELLRLVNFARTAPQVDDATLLRLSRAINDFRREANR